MTSNYGTVTRPADIVGANGRAWQIPMAATGQRGRPDADATVIGLRTAGHASPQRPIEGVRAPVIRLRDDDLAQLSNPYLDEGRPPSRSADRSSSSSSSADAERELELGFASAPTALPRRMTPGLSETGHIFAWTQVRA
jgi:hypothetical protein